MISRGGIHEKVFRKYLLRKYYRETTVNAKNVYSGAREIYQWLKTFVFPEVMGSIPSIDMTVYSHL